MDGPSLTATTGTPAPSLAATTGKKQALPPPITKADMDTFVAGFEKLAVTHDEPMIKFLKQWELQLEEFYEGIPPTQQLLQYCTQRPVCIEPERNLVAPSLGWATANGL
jgi:hypothetical protein